MALPVQTAEWCPRPGGAPASVVGDHASSRGSYRAPVPVALSPPEMPPQMIKLLPVQTALWKLLAVGASLLDTRDAVPAGRVPRRGRRVAARDRRPAVGARVVAPPGRPPVDAPPDQHLAAGPDRRRGRHLVERLIEDAVVPGPLPAACGRVDG